VADGTRSGTTGAGARLFDDRLASARTDSGAVRPPSRCTLNRVAMSAIRTLPALVLLACLGCSPASQTLTEEERAAVTAEVTAAMTAMTEAMNAHDPERVMAFYTDAPEFLALTCTSFISGGATYKAMVSHTYGPRRGTTFEQRVVSVQPLSTTAALVTQAGGSSRAPALFWTRALVKQDDRWIITYEHQSWPGCSPPPEPHPSAVSPGTTLIPPEAASS
jgi:ketosteroid isomerase-like protein